MSNGSSSQQSNQPKLTNEKPKKDSTMKTSILDYPKKEKRENAAWSTSLRKKCWQREKKMAESAPPKTKK